MSCIVDYKTEAIINYLSDSISFKISEIVKIYASSAMTGISDGRKTLDKIFLKIRTETQSLTVMPKLQHTSKMKALKEDGIMQRI